MKQKKRETKKKRKNVKKGSPHLPGPARSTRRVCGARYASTWSVYRVYHLCAPDKKIWTDPNSRSAAGGKVSATGRPSLWWVHPGGKAKGVDYREGGGRRLAGRHRGGTAAAAA
jgi:hypothetical protein